MVDINTSNDVKVFGTPAVPAVEKEDQLKSQVQPVEEGSETVKGELDDKALHEKTEQSARLQLTQEEVSELVGKIQERLDLMGTRLGFAVHQETQSVVVQIMDRESGELLKQLPSEELLSLRQKLEDLVGLLFDSKA